MQRHGASAGLTLGCRACLGLMAEGLINCSYLHLNPKPETRFYCLGFLAEAEVLREGTDVTLVGWGNQAGA